jgi:L-ribulose-5-phosphate 4-epimerase
MNKFAELKRQCHQSNLDLVKHGLVISTFGNASVIDRDAGVIAIKPSGINYDVLKPEDMVVLDFDGNVIEGTLNPSSDTKTHLVLYNHFPNIRGVVHTHSTYAVAWAQAYKPIPIIGTTHADYLHVDIPCTKFMADDKITGDYEIETGNQILEIFRKLSYEEIEMVLVAGHGPFTWGNSPGKAVHNSLILEELAKIAYLTIQINPQISPLKETLIKKHYERKHGPNAYYGQK